MFPNDTGLKTEVIYYGKKSYYLNEELATRIDAEQLNIDYTPREVELTSTNSLH